MISLKLCFKSWFGDFIMRLTLLVVGDMDLRVKESLRFKIFRLFIRIFNLSLYPVISVKEYCKIGNASWINITDQREGLNYDVRYLGDEDVIASSIERKLMSAPGIINDKYKGDFITKPMKYGMINVVDDYNNPRIITEEERLKMLKK